MNQTSSVLLVSSLFQGSAVCMWSMSWLYV